MTTAKILALPECSKILSTKTGENCGRAKAVGAEVTYLDFRSPLPLYDGELEGG